MTEELLEAWRTNNRVNIYLIDHISAAGMRCTLSKRGGRDVAGQFAHLHNVRIWQLQNRAKDLAVSLNTFTKEVRTTKASLKKALIASGKGIESFLTELVDETPRRRGFKKGIPATLAYFINHEAHHRGIILLTLKESGHKLDKKHLYTIYNWDKI